jgi:twitching motility protein PilT
VSVTEAGDDACSGAVRREARLKPIDELLKIMIERNASDLHLKSGSPPVIRVDGELGVIDDASLVPDDTKEYAATIMSDRQIRKFSEHSEVDFAYSLPGLGRYRVNVYRQRGSISIAMRRVATKIPTFDDLHLPQIVQQLSVAPRGMVLVTGTTGSGKSTTLAAMIDHINQNLRRHIITVEDPIEVLHRDNKSVINQREIGLDTDTYVTALKYVLRQDPDVILIGEMRDAETVSAALTAAQTGHFVMSTLHTIDATETINRIIDFFPLHQQKQVRIMLAGTLRGIISQRLLPHVSGSGRVPAVEIMVLTNRIRDFVLDPEQAHLIHDAIKEGEYYGMQTFDQSLLKLYEEGMISLSDAAQVAANPHDFKLLVQQAGHDVNLVAY